MPAETLAKAGGGKRDRTADPLLAKQVLFQLSYTPVIRGARNPSQLLVGLGRVELPTSPLSGVRSSQLSYRPLSSAEPARLRPIYKQWCRGPKLLGYRDRFRSPESRCHFTAWHLWKLDRRTQKTLPDKASSS